MIFDTQLNVAVTEVVAAEGHIQQVLGLVTGVPISQAGMLPIPLGQLRIPMTKEEAQQLVDKLQQAIAETPDPEPQQKSDLVVAKSLQDVEQIANIDRKVKGQ